jgi:hypothetical protein
MASRSRLVQLARTESLPVVTYPGTTTDDGPCEMDQVRTTTAHSSYDTVS